ncbi:MAG: hypothetical protein J7639_03860 [Paenibacillaceae bacterium]|nr:hypothetical protein [Paenibacillaceae bacterium]
MSSHYQPNRAAAAAIPSVRSTDTWIPPRWALLEHHLMQTLNKAAEEFAERYIRPDGTLTWRKDWPGMDGSDDPYEGFMYLSLLYVLGGSEKAHQLGRLAWEGITWQWTQYGQIYRDFDAYYDWMHHGEGYLYFYFLGLTDPLVLKDRQRAQRFAAMYTGDDAEADNYDKERKLIRSPITGSRGPRHVLTEEDWCTHRGILDNYLAPYEDIPGVDFASGKCQWSNDEIYGHIVRLMNERMTRGDVPLNLNATGLITHAFLYSGEESLRQWVLGYIDAWSERTERNGGIMPDNVGLNGEIGQFNDGKWWGGYYGWRWPHGFMTIIEPLVNASMNAVLLTGDRDRLRLAREQIDRNWALGREENGKWVTPHKHFDTGWAAYKVPNPVYPVYLWTVSMAEEDAQRLERIAIQDYHLYVDVPNYSGGNPRTGKETKHYIANTVPWFQYMRGQRPDYPERILEANCQLVSLQLEKLRSPEGDPSGWTEDGFSEGALSSIHKWQEMCPVYFEGLLQLMLGAPMHISHGGLQHGRVRYFDAQRQRPGLPESVAALVSELADDSVTLSLVNLDLFAEKEVIIQAGTFGEHRFETAYVLASEQGTTAGAAAGGSGPSADAAVQAEIAVGGKWFAVQLAPGAGLQLRIAMQRYVNQPTYATPWADPADDESLIIGR